MAGQTAVVSSGGDNATLRDDASVSANAIGSIPDGTEVTIIEGPLTGADGSNWYYAGVWDQTGYISGSLLSPASQADSPDTTSEPEAAPAEEPSSSVSLPWLQPIDYGVVADNGDAPLPGDGLACRNGASNTAEVIVRMWVNQSIEITGQSVWAEGIELLPVNCAGEGGFVKADYVALNSESASAESALVEQEPVIQEEAPVDEVVTDPEAVVEQPDENAEVPVAGDLIVTVLDQNGAAVPGTCFAIYQNGVWTGEACDSNDAIPNNGNSGFFGIPAGGYSLVASAAPDGTSIDNREVLVDVGTTAYVTVSAVIDTPVVTEAVTETEEVVEEPATEATGETTEVAITEEAVNEEAAAEVAEEATDETAEVTATEEAADEPTGVATTENVTEEAATEEATEAIEVAATEEAATDEPVTEEVVEEATEVATIAAGSELGEPIGDATVTGANGEGLRCRVAPDANSPVITVLPEGTTVFVYNTSGTDYLEIGCGGQLGYGDVNLLWAGGAGDEIPSNAPGVVVVGTGGMKLNCRSGAGTGFGVVATVSQGSVLTSRGPSSNGWAPVVCNGMNGFVSISYVEVSGDSGNSNSGNTGGNTASAGTATVSNTGGDGLRCRTMAPNGATITVLAEGSVVTTRGAESNGWAPIVCNGQNGFASATYLTLDSTSGGTTPAKTPDTGNGSSKNTGYVKVMGTGGASLNCRTAASMSGMVITAIPYNSTASTRGASANGWTPVTCGGQNGYVSSMYVTSTSGGGTTSDAPKPADPGSGSGVSGTATVTGTGSSLRCRSAANTSSATVTFAPDGTVVKTRGASGGGWTPVVCGGQNGYMSSMYLMSGGGAPTSPTPAPVNVNASGMSKGDHGKVSVRANMRYQASLSANVVVIVDSDEVLLITGNASNGFLPVSYDGLNGFMSADLLSKTSAPLSERGGSGNEPEPAPAKSGGGSNATGNAMANYAMRYVGYPYVWATSGPSSFDCSGFTYWVTKNVHGANIGTGLWTQASAGASVSRSNLQPGDLVFFQNTYKAGLSHVGIYIGNDQFVHAENENTGVRVSSLNSTYYGSRWYGAVRMG